MLDDDRNYHQASILLSERVKNDCWMAWIFLTSVSSQRLHEWCRSITLQTLEWCQCMLWSQFSLISKRIIHMCEAYFLHSHFRFKLLDVTKQNPLYLCFWFFLLWSENPCRCPLVCFSFLPNTSCGLRGNLLKVLAALLSKVFSCVQLKVIFVSLIFMQNISCNLCKTNSSNHMHFAKNWISQQHLW